MAAELKTVEENEDKPDQLALFEGTPVHEYKASLTAAGYLDLADQKLKVGERVEVTTEGWVTKVVFHKHKGIVRRQHIIAVDVETVAIKGI